MIKKIIWKTFFFSFILFLISCSNGLFTEDDSEPANNGKTYIVVSNKSTISRMALLPITPKAGLSDLTSIALTGERTKLPDGTLISDSSSESLASSGKYDDLPTQIAIEPGTWTFTLTAELDGIGFKSTIEDMEIKAGVSTPLQFTLTPETETKGGLNIKVTFPSQATIVFVDFRKQDATDAIIYKNFTPTTNEPYQIKQDSENEDKSYITILKDITSGTLDPGNYLLKCTFRESTGSASSVTLNKIEVDVTIAAGITTTEELYIPSLDASYSINYHTYTEDNKPSNYSSIQYLKAKTLKYSRTTESVSLPDLSLTGYNFAGWYDNPDFSGEPISGWTANQKVGDIDLYAKWTPRTNITYTVKHWKQKVNGTAATHNASNYELVDEADTESKTGTTDTLVSFELKDTSTTDPADAFYGFKAPKEEEITAAQALTISGDGTLEVNLYYERQYVTVMYYKDSSTHIQSEKTSRYGQSFTVLATEPTKEGYTFTGWAIKANASETDTIYRVGTANNKYTLNSIETVKLYAQWQPITYTVTFNTNGGSSIDTQTVQHGKLAEQPKDAPTKEDYSFAGWYTDNKYTTEFNFAKTQITKNTTIYAKWVLDAHYAKIDGTYYDNYSAAKGALTDLSTGEHTIVFYSVDVAELGKTSDATGALFNIIANSHATAVHLIIHEDANLVFGSNNEAAFSCFNNLVSADLRGLKSAVTLGSMFDYCINLESVIFAEDFDTSNIIYADGMFYNCSKLTTLDLSMFDTSKIARMTKMFAGCSSLTTIYVSDKFVTTSVLGDYAGQVFSSCTSLVGGKGTSFSELGVIDATAAKIDGGTSNPGYFTLKPSSDSVTLTFNTMGGSSIASQILESGSYAIRPKTPSKSGYAFDGWYTDSVCTTPFDFASPVTSDMTLYAKWVDRSGKFAKINDTFYEDFDSTMLAISKQLLYSGVKDITVTLYDSSLTASMLGNSASINTLLGAISNKDGSNNSVYDSVSLIFDAGAGIILGGAECMSLFQECQSLVYVDLSGIITKSLSDMGGMFKACQKLETVIFGDHFDTSKVGNMGEMFYHDLKLSHVDFGNLDTRNVQYMCSMLQECSSLTEIDISSFEPSSIKDISYMFADCINLKTIYASSKFVIPDKATDTAIFGNCTSLVGEKGTAYDSKYIGKEFAQLDGGPKSSTPGYFSKKPSQSLNCSVGDVILVDGTVIPYTESMELNSEQQATAIAVIFYDGKGSLGDKPLGVGIYQRNNFQSTPICIATSKAIGFSRSLNSDDNSGKVFTQAIYACEDYTDETSRDYYPVFNALEKYYKETGGLLEGSSYSSDWYLPSKNELLTIKERMELINFVLSKINNKDGSFFNTKNNYWAAYQSTKKEGFTGYVNFGVSGSDAWQETEKADTSISAFVCAIHEF